MEAGRDPRMRADLGEVNLGKRVEIVVLSRGVRVIRGLTVKE
jgi:hypothetical protein